MEEAEARSESRKAVLASILGLVAVVLVWRAIWDIAEKVMYPLTSLAIGLVLLAAIAYLKKEYIKKIFF